MAALLKIGTTKGRNRYFGRKIPQCQKSIYSHKEKFACSGATPQNQHFPFPVEPVEPYANIY